MTEILAKDLDKYDDSLAARQPFSLKEESVRSPQFMTGDDLVRSAKINASWKLPVAIPAQASKKIVSTGLGEAILSGGRATIDTIADLPSNLANLSAQTAIELVGGEKKEKTIGEKLLAGTEVGGLYNNITRLLGMGFIAEDLIKNRKEYEEKIKTYDDAVSLVENRDYPLIKYAQRVLADTTKDVESRRVVRELYKQAQGIDSSKWYNQAGSIIGAMVPTLAVARGAGSTARAFGASRASATAIAQAVAKGYIGAEMAGQYAEETAAQYLERTGDKNFENFTAKDASGLGAMAYGAIGAQIEFMGGVEPIMAGALSKVGLRSSLLSAGIKIGAGEAGEEFLQGITELLMRKIDNTSDKTWKEGFEESLKGAAWGLFIGGSLGATTFHVNRRNLVKGIKTAIPNISDEQAKLVADAMIDSTAEISSQDQTLRNNLRSKVALMYRDSDIDNKDNIIDATTDLEYSLIAMDSAERGIDIAENPIFKGEVNELGWFRDNIPEERRAEIQLLNDEIVALKDQLAKENAQEEKNWEKIDELENKLEQSNQYILDKLSNLARDDANSVRRMLRGVEQKYVSKQKKKAGLPTGEEAVFKVFPDEKFNAEEKHIEPYEYTHADNKFRYKDDGIHHVIELLDSNNNVLSVIEINKSNSGVNSINTFEETNWRKGYGSTLLREAERLFGDNLTVRPESTELAQGFWKRKNRYTEEIRPGVFRKARQVMFQEQFDLADENARLDDIYPEYKGETIEVDGKERTVYNSNGDRIAKSKEALTNFWRWFGDSKVVDEQGRPIVMYHGTSSVFDTFDSNVGHITDSGFFGSGFYFTPIKSEAEYYGRIVMPVYLKIEKPFIISTGGYYSGLYDNLFEGGGQLLKDLGLLAENDLKDFNKYERLKKEFLKNVKVEKIYTYDAKHTEIQVWRASFEKNGRSYESNSYRPWEEVGYNEKADTKENALNNAWGEYAHFNDLNFLIQDLSFTDYIRTNGLAENLSNIIKSRGYDGTIAGDEHIVFEPTQIKSVDNRGTFSSYTGNIYWQNRVSGGAPATYRGAYIPQYRFIQRSNRMDASTLSHELAHDWMEVNFARYRDGTATPEFMRSWGALEKALGIEENATQVPRQASETFARAYEAWITSNEDWTKVINIDDKDKDTVEKLLKDYQGDLRDIYNDISNPYFKQTWGKLGELKPELKAWFDRVANITDLDVLAERGEITEAQAAQEKLNRAIDTVIETTQDAETAQTLKEVRTLNDVERYEVEGGNKNSIQRRLSALAREIDENNMAVKGDKYDTRRDMMAVAEAADNFVKTRLDDALAIINGEMAEVEGLYKEDLYTALERLAVENGDLGLIDELKNSEVANRLAKELGQRVAGFRNFKQSTDIDVVSALKSLDIKFNKALDNKKAKQQFDSALKLLDESIAQQDKIADKELDNFLTELECK